MHAAWSPASGPMSGPPWGGSGGCLELPSRLRYPLVKWEDPGQGPGPDAGSTPGILPETSLGDLVKGYT